MTAITNAIKIVIAMQIKNQLQGGENQKRVVLKIGKESIGRIVALFVAFIFLIYASQQGQPVLGFILFLATIFLLSVSK